MALREYRKKRNFRHTPEPRGGEGTFGSGRLYAIQKHAARRLHYDLRLELDGVLKSWAIPKGPSLDPADKRLAVHVEDHPLEYGSFEGIIPEGEYGGGTVMLWDKGQWEPEGDPGKSYRKGRLVFRLSGEKLRGSWILARMGGSEDGENWLLIKKEDGEAKKSVDIVSTQPHSALTGRTMEEISASEDRVWSGTEGELSPASSPRSPRGLKSEISKMRGARRSEMASDPPRPQLATLVKEAPTGEQWLHEIKYDGYRILCIKRRDHVRLITRNGQDWTDKLTPVARSLSSLPMDCIFDGEVVVAGPGGKADFQALQNILAGLKTGNLVYYAFDILYCAGHDVTSSPLVERKKLLKKLFESFLAPSSLIYGDYIQGDGDRVFEQACRLGTEGIVSKRADSRYEEGRRSRSWVKVKCVKRQEFVIGGYTEPSGSRSGFGALLVGYYDESGSLSYAGRVGTGFDESALLNLTSRLKKLERRGSPFRDPPKGRDARGVHWVQPALVGEVEFTEWTDDGILRHPSFKGLREDKTPLEVRRETGKTSSPATGGTVRRNTIAGVTLSNPDRILYPEQGLSKRSLALYYEGIAERILPHLVDRPLTLVRCPKGRQKKCFYQKHLSGEVPESLLEISIQEKKEKGSYAVVKDLAGLISLVQLGVLEIHPWGSRRDQLERPDRIVFDLDPGPGIQSEHMVEVVQLLHELLNEIGLKNFLKTSGGKGFHVVVPLVRHSGWAEVKAFAKNVAVVMTRMRPDLVISTMEKSKRREKIFVDYLRNTRGATAVAPYSTRARAGAPVSAPIRWEDFSAEISSDQFTVENLSFPEGESNQDPWDGFFDIRQSLTKRIKDRLKM
jgi:bifunctional non-homologous end joining protein LigD